jgi:hypothetical protein
MDDLDMFQRALRNQLSPDNALPSNLPLSGLALSQMDGPPYLIWAAL